MSRYYKYLTPDGARPTLLNGTLRWSRPTRFNDLFDMAVPFSTDFDREYVGQRTTALMWSRIAHGGDSPSTRRIGRYLEAMRETMLPLGEEEFTRRMSAAFATTLVCIPAMVEDFSADVLQILRMIKVVCLSELHDDNTMWGLYAGNHQGVVLEFANAPGIDSVYRLAKPVTYADRAPPFLDDEKLAQLLAGNTGLARDIVAPLMYLKSRHWSYERELRLVSGEGRRPSEDVEDVPFHPDELVGVYFGARAQALRNELEPMVLQRYPHARLWQASQGPEFRIDFSAI